MIEARMFPESFLLALLLHSVKTGAELKYAERKINTHKYRFTCVTVLNLQYTGIWLIY